MRLLLILLSSLLFSTAHAQLDDIPFDDIPRPGSQGELTAAIDRAIEEQHQMMERIKQERLLWFDRQSVAGHSIKIIPEGHELLEERLKSIRGAQKSIYLSTFIYDKDETGLRIAKALCLKAKRGVDVRMMLDSFGSKGFYNEYAERMRACGVGILLFNPPSWGLNKLPYVIHEKLLIIDGQTVHMGGNGVQNSYHHVEPAHKFFHDFDMKIQGPIACILQRKLEDNYKRAISWDAPADIMGSGSRSREYERHLFGPRYFEPCEEQSFGEARMMPVYTNPLFTKERPIWEAYRDAILATEKEIKLYAPYFVPHEKFIAGLLWARKNNVKVTVLTNSIESNDEGVGSLVGMVYKVGKLLKAGVEIKLWKGPMTLHRKSGIYDNKWAYIGSDNLDIRGHEYSSESIAFSDDRNFVERVNQEYDKDMENTFPLTKEYMQKILEKSGKFNNWAIRNIVINYL